MGPNENTCYTRGGGALWYVNQNKYTWIIIEYSLVFSMTSFQNAVCFLICEVKQILVSFLGYDLPMKKHTFPTNVSQPLSHLNSVWQSLYFFISMGFFFSSSAAYSKKWMKPLRLFLWCMHLYTLSPLIIIIIYKCWKSLWCACGLRTHVYMLEAIDAKLFGL